MSDLKPNPFCGHPVSRDTVSDDQHRDIVCAVDCNDDHVFRMSDECWNSRPIEDALRLALAEATRERDEALRTVKALTPAANYCLEYKPLLLKAKRERDEAVRTLRDIATFGWYAKGAKVARAYLAAKAKEPQP